MQRMLTPLAAACLLAMAPMSAIAAYSSMVVFGDSLSDAGNFGARFTTPVTGGGWGNTSPMFINDMLGLEPQKSAVANGQNYAVGGATTSGIKNTVDKYLSGLSSAGKAIDPNALYYINGGGNDFLQGSPNVVTGSQNMGDALKAMQSAGIRNFMMPLLVDAPSPNNASQSEAYQNALKALAADYNKRLIDQASSISANVIVLNVPLLYEEVLANPGLYGFAGDRSFLVSNCYLNYMPVANSATNCNKSVYGQGQSADNADKLIYADAVHPSTAMQKVLAGQGFSILAAPWQISLLPEMASGSLRSSQDAVRNQFNADWGQWQAVGQWRGFVTGGYSQQNFDRTEVSASGDGKGLGLNIGASYRVDENWRAGLALSLQDQELEAGEQDSEFDLKSYIGSAFAQYHDGLMWFDLSASLGHLDYSSLDRKFAMGPVTRTEKGSTDGKLWALSGRLGVELGVQDDALKISPFVSADYSRIDVDGYSEKAASSTGLSYGDQKRTSERLGLGVQARYQFSERTSAFGEIAREKEFKDGSNDIKMNFNAQYAGVSLPGVKLQGYETQNALTRFNLGLKHQLNEALALQAAYNYRHGADDNLHGANLSLVFDW